MSNILYINGNIQKELQHVYNNASNLLSISDIPMTWSHGNKNGDRYKDTIHINVLYTDGNIWKTLEIPLYCTILYSVIHTL